MTSFLGLANQVITFTTNLDYTTLLYKPTSIIIEERLGWQWSHNHSRQPKTAIKSNLQSANSKCYQQKETSDKLDKEHQNDTGVLQNLSDIS